MPLTVTASRRMKYVEGYAALEQPNEAIEELEAIEGKDRQSIRFLLWRLALYIEVEKWDVVDEAARVVTAGFPKNELAWISWAGALTMQNRREEVVATLLAAEPHIGKKSARLHYNLGCNYSLKGDQKEAMRRIEIACKLDDSCNQRAQEDPELKGM